MAYGDPSQTFLNPTVGKQTNQIDPAVAAWLAANGGGATAGPNDPLVIPNITQAYQNDPRTKLAVDAIKTGTSTDPVARGKYGIADGIARALTGIAGTYSLGQDQSRYNKMQTNVFNAAQKNAIANLSGSAAAGAAPSVLDPSAPPQVGALPPGTNPDGSMAIPGGAVPPPSSAPALANPSAPLPPAPPVDPSVATPSGSVAGAVAAALGGPPAPGGPPPGPIGSPGMASGIGSPGMASGIPTGAVPPPSPTGTAQFDPNDPQGNALKLADATGNLANPTAGTGGSPQGTGPFASQGGPAQTPVADPSTTTPSDSTSKGKYALPDVPIPAAPPPLPEPTMPAAIPARRSVALDAAYKMLATGGPGAYSTAMELYGKGLASQDTLNDAADARAEALIDKKFGTQEEIWATSQGDDRRAQLTARQSALDAEVQNQRDSIKNQLTSDITDREQAGATQRTAMETASAQKVAADARAQAQAQFLITERDRVDARNINQANKIDAYYRSPQAARINSQIDAANEGLAILGQAKETLSKPGYHPGGGVANFVPGGVLSAFSQPRSDLEGYYQRLVLNQAKLQAGSGSSNRGSNMALKVLQMSKPSVNDPLQTQQKKVDDLTQQLLRTRDYNVGLLHANAIGDGTYEGRYGQYQIETQGKPFQPYETWLSKSPYKPVARLDINGNPIVAPGSP